MITEKKWRTIEVMVSPTAPKTEDVALHELIDVLRDALNERGIGPSEVLFPFPQFNPKPVPGSKEARNGGFKFYILIFSPPLRHGTWNINL